MDGTSDVRVIGTTIQAIVGVVGIPILVLVGVVGVDTIQEERILH